MKEAYTYLTNIIAILKDWHKAGTISLPEKQQLTIQLDRMEKVFRTHYIETTKEEGMTKDKAFILQNPFPLEIQCYRGAIYVEMKKLVEVTTKRG